MFVCRWNYAMNRSVVYEMICNNFSNLENISLVKAGLAIFFTFHCVNLYIKYLENCIVTITTNTISVESRQLDDWSRADNWMIRRVDTRATNWTIGQEQTTGQLVKRGRLDD